MCVALVASLTEEMAAQNIAYHAHGTADGVASLTKEMAARSIAYHAHGKADGGKFCWLVCHDIKSAMHFSLRLAPMMINHLTSYSIRHA